jgi:uncharacterized protein YciI
MLIIELTYKKELAVVEKHLVAHRDFLQYYYDEKSFIMSGPKNPRVGGIIIANIEREKIQTIIEQDPFYIHKVADYQVTEFNAVKYVTELKPLLEHN